MKLLNKFAKMMIMGLLFMIVAVGCGSSGSDGGALEPEIESGTSLDGTSWVLQEFGPDGDRMPMLPDTSVTLVFEDGRISGSANCNTFFADVTQSGDALDFGPIGSTRMACAEPIMQQENAFLAAMSSVSHYVVAEGQLTLTYDGGLLVFATAPAEGDTGTSEEGTAVTPTATPHQQDSELLQGTSWVLESFGPMDNVTAVLPNSAPTLNFEAGQVNGNASCNSYSGEVTLDEDGTMTVSMLVSTLMACADQAMMQQEADFMAALAQVTSYTLSGSQLTLQTPDGVLNFEAAE